MAFIGTDVGRQSKNQALHTSEAAQIVHEHGGQWNSEKRSGMICCPCHDDNDPSLKVSETATGYLNVQCFAGCSTKKVRNALGLDEGVHTSNELTAPAISEKSTQIAKLNQNDRPAMQIRPLTARVKRLWDEASANLKQIKKHPYIKNKKIRNAKTLRTFRVDKEGNLLVPVCNVERQLRSILFIRNKGGIVKKSENYPDGIRYEFEKLFLGDCRAKGGMTQIGNTRDPETIFICEGIATGAAILAPFTKDEKRKFLVVCAHSAGNIPEVTKLLSEKYGSSATEFILAMDQDKAGRHAVQQTSALVPRLPFYIAYPGFERPSKRQNDFDDLLRLNGGLDVRDALLSATPAIDDLLRTIRSWEKFNELEYPPVVDAMYPILQFPGSLQLNAQRGDYKTWIALYICVGLACGVGVFDWVCERPFKVLFLDGELPPHTLQERLRAVVAQLGVCPEEDHLQVFSASEHGSGATINLADPNQTHLLYDKLSAFDVVCIDNISAFTSRVDPNSAEPWQAINDLLRMLIAGGTSVIRVQHLGKDPSRGARGSSIQEDPLDTNLILSRQAPTTDGNTVIKIKCNKMRNHDDTAFNPIELEVGQDDEGLIRFKHRSSMEKKKERIETLYLELKESGEFRRGSIQEIAGQVGVTRSYVSRIIRALKKDINEE